MNYTYVISKNPTGEDFKALCKRIPELYPEYERTGGKKYADGAENVRWEKGYVQITAELEADPAILTVNSDMPLPELEKEYHLLEKDNRVKARREGFASFILKLTANAVMTKFVFIPGAILAVFAGLALFASGIFGFEGLLQVLMMIPLAPIALLAVYAVMLGWVWLVPAGMAVNFSARLKSPYIVKLLVSLLPALSVLYSCFFFGMTDYSRDIFGLLPILPVSLPLLYYAALPYLAIDEIACRSLVKFTGKRPKAKVSVICWVLSFIAAAGVLQGFRAFEDNFSHRWASGVSSHAIGDADRMYRNARSELIWAAYGDDIRAVAVYAFTEKCTDWRECPDKSLEAPWRRLFLSGAADYELRLNGDVLTLQIEGMEIQVTAVPAKEE